MPDYDLSRLSSYSFEQLIQSLAVRLLGPGIVFSEMGRMADVKRLLNVKSPFPRPTMAGMDMA